MKTAKLTVISLALLTSFVGAEPPNADNFISNLKQMLRKAITDVDTTVNSTTVFLIAAPGVPLDDSVDLNDSSGLEAFNTMMDSLPAGDLSGEHQLPTFSSVWKRIITNHKSLTPTDPELTKQLQQAGKELDAMMTDYYNYYVAWLQARQKWLEAKTPSERAIAQAMVSKAQSEWDSDSKGKRILFGEKWTELEGLRLKAGAGVSWGSLAADFSNAQAATFPVFTWPKYGSWKDESGWMKVRFSSHDLQKTTNTSTSSGGAGGGWAGIFKGRVDRSKTVEMSSQELNDMGIELEVKRVLVRRTWMDPTVFYIKTWTWDQPSPPVSDGKMDAQGKFPGLLPLVPTSMILVRNVKLSTHFDAATSSQISSQMSASGGWSFGPFSCGGQAANSSESYK